MVIILMVIDSYLLMIIGGVILLMVMEDILLVDIGGY